MGGRSLQAANDLQGRLPNQPAKVQVRTAAVPPERVPLGNGLFVAARRREGLASGDHDQTDSARHPGSAERTEHQGSRPSGSVHYLLVSILFPGGCCLIL